jgi:hypothetical protein
MKIFILTVISLLLLSCKTHSSFFCEKTSSTNNIKETCQKTISANRIRCAKGFKEVSACKDKSNYTTVCTEGKSGKSTMEIYTKCVDLQKKKCTEEVKKKCERIQGKFAEL